MWKETQATIDQLYSERDVLLEELRVTQDQVALGLAIPTRVNVLERQLSQHHGAIDTACHQLRQFVSGKMPVEVKEDLAWRASRINDEIRKLQNELDKTLDHIKQTTDLQTEAKRNSDPNVAAKYERRLESMRRDQDRAEWRLCELYQARTDIRTQEHEELAKAVGVKLGKPLWFGRSNTQTAVVVKEKTWPKKLVFELRGKTPVFEMFAHQAQELIDQGQLVAVD